MSLPPEPPSHLPLHPTPLGCYRLWFEFPESYSKFPLAIYFIYGNVSFHVTVSICPNLSFSPTPAPGVHKSVLYVCELLLILPFDVK